MASNKLIKGILGALDEKLGTGLLRAEGRSLAGSGAKLIGKTPVKNYPMGVLAKPKDLSLENVHRDLITKTDPLHRMLHGTGTPNAYDRPTGYLNDIGLHLSQSPGIATKYATSHRFSPTERGLGGPRVYPLLVDPGRVHKGITIDAGPWYEPKPVAGRIREMMEPDEISPELDAIVQHLEKGKPVDEVFQDYGYDSVEFGHGSPFNEDDYSSAPATMLFDPRRAIPEFTQLGQTLKKKRGVLGLNPEQPIDDEYTMANRFSRGQLDDFDTLLNDIFWERNNR